MWSFPLLVLLAAPTHRAFANDWGALEGAWVKLPVACPHDLDAMCYGDNFTLKNGTLNARKSCNNVQIEIRSKTEDTWRVAVVGAKPCIWAKGINVRYFVFTIGPAPSERLRFTAYSREGGAGKDSLFNGSGFERQ